jgi:hypothetical protein
MQLEPGAGWVAAFDRNRWPLCLGMGGRFPSESVAALARIPHHPLNPRANGAILECASCTDAHAMGPTAIRTDTALRGCLQPRAVATVLNCKKP